MGDKMRLGFIGTGAITTALVTGLCTAKPVVDTISVSPRNRAKSELLQKRFSQIVIGRDNQDVVDNSDVIVLAVLPGDLVDIVEPLNTRGDQIIVNLLSGTPNSRVAESVNRQCTVVRAVPLPCAAEHIGPIVVYPGNKTVDSIFGVLGSVISVEKEEHLEHLSIITSLMAPYFEMLGTITDWAKSVGVDQKQAADYTASMFAALSVLAQKSPTGDLHQLADESMTPGGLNELARKIISEAGGYNHLEPVLQAVASRVLRARHSRD